MQQGYVKLWRKSLDSPSWDNPNIWRLWTWCLIKATYKSRTVKVGYQDVQLEPGQFIFGRLKASLATGLSEREIRTSLQHLENMQNLTIKATNKYSIITIVNWAEYQEEPTNNSTSKRPASDQQATTNNNIKKVKKVKNIKNNTKILIPPTIEEVTAYCKERNNNVNPQHWYNHYTSNGWKVGKNKMVDWKAAVRTWEAPHGNTRKGSVSRSGEYESVEDYRKRMGG